MKRDTLHALLVLSIMATSLTLGCLMDDEKAEGDLEFTDGMGESIVLDGVPERIITLTPALTEIIFLLECQDRLVGCDSDSDFPQDASSVEKVSSWQGMNTERILELEPDIVFMDRTLDASGDRYDALKNIGLTVYRIYPLDLDEVIGSMVSIGDVLGVKEDAQRVAGHLRERMDAVRGRAILDPQAERPEVLHVIYYDGSSDPWVMTNSTFSGDMISIAGGACAISDGSGLSIQVSLESIIDADPDIIICSQSSTWPTASRELLMEDDALLTVSAVRDDRVYDIDGAIIDRTGPRLVNGIEEIRLLIEDYHG